MDDVRLSIDFLVGLLSLESILESLRALSQVHGVYLRLVLAVLLTALDVRVDFLTRKELFHSLVYAHSCSWDRDRDVLLMLYCDLDVLRIGTLPSGITRQGLGSCCN